MEAHANLKSSRAQPHLVELPTVAHLTEHLHFWHAAVLENQLARFGPHNNRDAAHNSISRRSRIDQKASHSLATFRARQAREELHEVRDIGKGWKHLRPIDDEVVAIRRRGRLKHGRVGAGCRFTQAECRSLFSTNTREQETFYLLASTTIEDI